MSRITRSPSIPEGGEEAVQALKESMEVGLGRRGNQLEKFVTFRDLVKSGMRVEGTGGGMLARLPGSFDGSDEESAGGLIPGGALDFGQNNLDKPPRPRQVRAKGLSMSSIGVSWLPHDYDNHAYAEVFASKSDNWAHVRTTFDLRRPVGQGNSTPYFMGATTTNLFLHRDLQATVPTLQIRFGVTGMNAASGVTTVSLEAPSGFQIGDQVFFSGDPEWGGNGFEASVTQVLANGIVVDGEVPGGVEPGVTVDRVLEQDELDAALSPDPIYYWVRFVSQANIVGDVQSEAGVPGSVFIDPEAVLNIMTGRIRASNLANDLLSPINYVRGPLIPRLDLADYNIEQLGQSLSTQIGRINSLDFEVNDSGGRLAAVEGYFVSANFPSASAFGAWVDDLKINVTNSGSTLESLETWQAEFDPSGNGGALASRLNTIELNASSGAATASDINALEATIGGVSSSGTAVLARALNQRFVKATDSQALAWMRSELAVDFDQSTQLNQIQQSVDYAEGQVNNAISLKVQSVANGIWTTAGFGIGMQGDPNNPGTLNSTFAVAADEFAIMAPGLKGRKVAYVRPWGTNRHRIDVDNGGSNFYTDYPIGQRIVVVVPPGSEAWKTALRGKAFKVISRSYSGGRYYMVVEKADNGFTALATTYNVSSYQVGVFHEQAIPFVVDTASGTVGIRGKLVVDGLITADEADVSDLAATQIWSENITNFGLLSSKSIIGQAIATPRIGGWAVRINQPNFDANRRVIEFSRWSTGTDSVPSVDANGQWQVNPSAYYHLSRSSNETAFYIGVKPNGQGTAYMRGSLLVDGSSRFVNMPASWGGNYHFTQMDSEFPMMVMSSGAANQWWMSVNSWDEWNYSGSESRREYIRRNAFFWIDRLGQAGFNTPSDAIYLNDNPLELPASSGSIKVIRRLGAQSQTGRVLITASFNVDSNRYATADRLGINYGLLLVPAHRSIHFYGSGYRAWSPTSRSFSAPSGSRSTGAPSTRNNFVICRWNAEQGYPARESLLSKYASDVDGYVVNQFYCNTTTPGGRSIIGSISVPAGDYKAVVVACELVSGPGGDLYGAFDTTFNANNNSRGAIVINQGHIHSQQTSDRSGL